jgi:hypothetical protein
LQVDKYLVFASSLEESQGMMSEERPDPPEEPHWATEWSSQRLTAEEKDVFEDVIADLYDWIALSIDSCSATVQDHCRALPPVIQKGSTASQPSNLV